MKLASILAATAIGLLAGAFAQHGGTSEPELIQQTAAEEERAAADSRAWMRDSYQRKVCGPREVAEWVDNFTIVCTKVLDSYTIEARR